MNGKIIFSLLFVFGAVNFCFSQTGGKNVPAPNAAISKVNPQIKTSSAYAEVLLRKTERESELEELLLDYTEEFPKVKELRFELGVLQKEMDKILATSAAQTGKLTLALGKLIVRKAEMEVELWNLKRQYNDEQPEVKRTKRKIEVFDKAISEILS